MKNIVFIISVLILFYSCKKEKTIPVPDNLVLYDEEKKQYHYCPR